MAYGQNGEMLRPENGYPLRLVVPGVQGVSWIKYLRRIEVGDRPYATKDESLHYMDLMPDGQHRQYTSIQEIRSVITSPSGGQEGTYAELRRVRGARSIHHNNAIQTWLVEESGEVKNVQLS
jgi:DMSO/TMAO reductase YedYZ molybdopterin-dependent catalytic subunit